MRKTRWKGSVARSRTEETKRLQQLFEQSPGMIAVVKGPNHVFEIANANYRQFVGNRDLIGKPAREALPELEEQGLLNLLDQVFTAGELYKGTAVPVSIQNPVSGKLDQRFVDFVYQPFRNEVGKVIGIFAEGFDVTETVRATNALRESELSLRQLANTIPQLAWIADATGAIYWYNDRWYEYTGTSPAEMQGWGWQSVHDPDQLPQVINAWKYSLATGKPFEMTFPLRDKAGTYRPFFTLVAPLKDSSGEIVQWFGTNTDVSSLHKVQEELRKTQGWLADGLLAGRMVVWEWDLVNQEVRYSDNSKEILGFASSDVSVSWSSVHPDDLDRLKSAVDRALQERGQFHERIRRIRPDNGELIWVESKGRVTTNNQGEPSCLGGIMIDVTERIKAEHELTDSNRRKDEFLAMLAHELRNPLAPISTAAQLLAIAGPDEVRVQQASNIISRQVKHMTDLVDDLLDVSRVTRGLVELQLEIVDIKSVVSNAIEQARPLIEARNHDLITHITSAQVVVRGDRTRLVQITTNLLNNAAKYTPPGGRIALTIEALEAQVKIGVADNGIGIDASLLPHVFELFTQAERTPDRSQGGLGLGLALVRSLMTLHGGYVEVSSEGRGQGCTFTLFLPLLANANPHSEIKNDIHPGVAAESTHLMIVDDNVDAAESLATLLKILGHRVTVMADPNSALKAAAQQAPAIFILDIGLPDMDGYELARRLRKRPETANALFIALTGYGQTNDKKLSEAAGFDYHFVKPIDIKELLEILGRPR